MTVTSRSPMPSTWALIRALLDGADAGGCAGEDQVARLELEQAGQELDLVRDVPDHLPRSPVCLRSPLTSSQIAPLAGSSTFRPAPGPCTGAECSKALATSHGRASFLATSCRSAARHVDADRIAEHVLHRVAGLDVRRRPTSAPPPARSRNAHSSCPVGELAVDATCRGSSGRRTAGPWCRRPSPWCARRSCGLRNR